MSLRPRVLGELVINKKESRMRLLVVLGFVAIASGYRLERSGAPVVLSAEQIALCGSIDTQGYLPGEDAEGGDCCSFIVCNAANLNKTGYLGKCMGGTVWNNEQLTCDDPKQVAGCDPTTCTVPMRTTALCPDDLESGQCCIGGREPIYTQLSDSTYTLGDGEHSCPGGQLFNVEDCCCEAEFAAVPPCDDLDSLYFTLPDTDPSGLPNDIMDKCCAFAQCWSNRTGYDLVPCMPPSVWNAEAKACDIRANVMECMDINCGIEMTDPPCPGPEELEEGQCCMAGQVYSTFEDKTMYMREPGPLALGLLKIQCCPEVDGVQMVF
ncbi:unnamed protein product, partial [Owenia fusiformis]